MPELERRHILERIDSALRRVEWVFALIAGYGVLFVTAVGCAEVIGRGLFNSPIFGAIDMIEMSMVLIALAGISLAQSNAGHIRMTVFIGFVKGVRAKSVVDLVAYLFAFALVAALVITCTMYGWNIFQRGGGTSQLYIPYWIAGLVIVCSLILLTLRLVLQIVAAVRIIIWPDARPYGLPPEATEQDSDLHLEAL